MKNRFNNLTAKEWLPFQKSFFYFGHCTEVLTQNILFFTKIDRESGLYPNIAVKGDSSCIARLRQTSELKGRTIVSLAEGKQLPRIDFVIFDLVNEIEQLHSIDEFRALLQQLTRDLREVVPRLTHRRFVLILARNKMIDSVFYPFAWFIATYVQQLLSLKDEKIGVETPKKAPQTKDAGVFSTTDDVLYALYFRKDENSALQFGSAQLPSVHLRAQRQTHLPPAAPFPAWQIIKPPPRKKNEILHPAKFPEVLIESFISRFSLPGDTIFDPMSGTGSTQLAALKLNRQAYGVELSPFFAQIARQRLQQFLAQNHLFQGNTLRFRILNKDARLITRDDFPTIDYLITSPPYWDMLNMKGAENQAKRRQKGLPTNYSEDENDLGNIEDYQNFLDELATIYFKLFDLLRPGAYMTIIVKNIKKKGKNFPLAWDLAFKLSEKYILCPESFWFQDDLRIAPYGYGNTWVSNTFHHYCLTFQKPLEGEKS
jgi:DNA modification methylase